MIRFWRFAVALCGALSVAAPVSGGAVESAGTRVEAVVVDLRLDADDAESLPAAPAAGPVHVVHHDGRQVAVIDGVSGPAFRLIPRPPALSPDSGRHAYWAQRIDGAWVLVIDFRVVPDLVAQRPGTVLASNERVAASLVVGDRWHVWTDGELGRPLDAVGRGSLLFSPDGRRLAYGASRDGRWFVVLDGREQPLFHGLAPGSLRFSPDSRRFAYAALERGQWYVFLDGRRGQRFMAVDPASIAFSPDARRLCYAARADVKWAAVLDEHVYGWADRVWRLTFTDDSAHLLHLAAWDSRRRVIVDGRVIDVDVDALARSKAIRFETAGATATALLSFDDGAELRVPLEAEAAGSPPSPPTPVLADVPTP